MAAPTKAQKWARENFEIVSENGVTLFTNAYGLNIQIDAEEKEACKELFEQFQGEVIQKPTLTLHYIVSKYPTDKLEHGYIPYYEQHLPIDCKSLLEIGCYKGNSIRMWRDAFPNAKIGAFDLFEEFGVPEDVKGLIAFKGNQAYPEDLEQCLAHDWDVVIDDGSHGAKDQWQTIDTFLRPGTMVIIEDLHCNKEAFYRQGLAFEDTILGSIWKGTFPYKHDLYLDKIVFIYAD